MIVGAVAGAFLPDFLDGNKLPARTAGAGVADRGGDHADHAGRDERGRSYEDEYQEEMEQALEDASEDGAQMADDALEQVEDAVEDAQEELENTDLPSELPTTPPGGG